MLKIFYLFFFLLNFIPHTIFAQESSFVSIVNPVRGSDFWDLKNQDPQIAVLGQIDILNQFNLPATWLYRFDALNDKKIIEALKKRPDDEKGLFLEVTPTLTNEAGVNYRRSQNWHSAGSAFLTGYDRIEREKIIDTAFEKFKKAFGNYPVSVGAWWLDSFSLDYMQKKYGILASLIVADQYTTDNYQIWGQYFSTPYYPSKKNALHPAQTVENKLPVVMLQWAARDPVNSYGNGVEESTFSVQANDYLDYHNLNTKYFSTLLDLYTKQSLNQFSHLVVGLENSYLWEKYKTEYKNQIEVLSKKKKIGEISVVTMKDFASWYKNRFPDFSPAQIIVADDPLGSFKKAVWFMNPYFRVGWFFNKDGSTFRDIRQYIDGEEELCFQNRCGSVNFATNATRVLDEVSFGQKWVIDKGKISDFKVTKQKDNFIISYKNEAGSERKIELLPRDISVDGKISSIDGAILEATKYQFNQKEQINLKKGWFEWSIQSVAVKIIKFLIFIIIGCLVPGLLLIKRVFNEEIPFWKKISLSLPLGFVLITLLFYLFSLIDFKQGIFIYLLINLLFLIKTRKQIFSNFSLKFKDKFSFILIGLTLVGTIFQQLPVFKSSLHFPYGLGFWGPNTHDGLWHISLINQLIKSATPPENPIFAREGLTNYHFFYDLFVALTNYVSAIPVADLLFRFYPIIFSLLLGILTYFLINLLVAEKNIWKQRLAYFFGIYLVYFAGSFGWIVEFIKIRHLGGESAFWANQSISFNLNPPFAISLLIIITIFQILPKLRTRLSILVITILAGSLIAFKAYPAILVLLSLLIVGILKRNKQYIYTFFYSSILSAILFLFTFSVDKQLIIFSPFWFIHSMIDSPDRVGWVRLSLARVAGWESGNWFKFFASEAISMTLFIVGNLGTRVVVLFGLTRMNKITKINNLFILFIFVLAMLSLIIPILFIQAGNPWNSIQFIYYVLYISAVVGGIVFAGIIQTNRIFAFIIIAIFLVITPINSWATANGYLSYQPHALVTKGELEALNFLKSQDDGVVLTYPYDEKLKTKIAEPWPIVAYDSTAYVSALSSKPVFVEDEPQNQILLINYQKRLVASKDFFQNSKLTETKFLQENDISYIYIQKIFNTKLDEGQRYKNIFENEEVVIYKVENSL